MFFKDNSHVQDEDVAIIDQQLNHHPYSELKEKVSLHPLSQIASRDILVFNICENILGSIVSYLSILKNKRAAQLLLSSQIKQDLLFDLIHLYKPNYICIPSSFELEVEGYKLIDSSDDIYLLESNSHFNHQLYDELAVLLSTSGSTGSPKLVRLSYKNLESNANSISEYLKITNNDRAFTTLPMSYAYGLSIINSHLTKGAAIILNDLSVTEKDFWSFIKESKATSFGGVPYTYQMLKRLKFESQELPSLRYITQAGGKLKPELVKYFASICENKNIDFVVMYGQTEATARMSYLPFSKCKEKPNSIGIPIPGGKFLLEDTSGEIILEPNKSGELIYKGKNVSLGYAQSSQDLALGDERLGTLKTGDIALKDEDGYFQIIGRKSRFLKICGNRYGLEDIENILSTNKIETIASGQDDLLVLFLKKENLKDSAKKIISKQTGIHQRYIKTLIIDEFPRNEYGKIDHSSMKALFKKEFSL